MRTRPDISPRIKATILALALLAAPALLAAGCDDLRGDSGRIETRGTMSAFALRVGDCLDLPSDREFDDVPVVPCGRAHELEVFAIVQHPAPDGVVYPSPDRLSQVSFDLCYAFFSGYVGRSYADSRLDIETFSPTRDSWNEVDDREIVCLLFDLESVPMYGTMRGSGR